MVKVFKQASNCSVISLSSRFSMIIQRGILLLLRTYQLSISPLLGPRCRFYPSCSQYARLAIEEHGAVRGTQLAIRRLCKCHPGHPGGIDEVPEKNPAIKHSI